jgi:hypothetical protein
MTAKVSEFTTVARGNGVPCNGDLFEETYEGETYQAEFYLDKYHGGGFYAALAASSKLKKKVGDEWMDVSHKVSDQKWAKIISAITPDVVDDTYDISLEG